MIATTNHLGNMEKMTDVTTFSVLRKNDDAKSINKLCEITSKGPSCGSVSL